jgi:riboflavin synthase
MFSGIVETTAKIIEARAEQELLRITIERPKSFEDLHRGDSICVDGVCLTIEEFDSQKLLFALGPETLKVTGWTQQSVLNRAVNLERSLRLQDRIHGHLVTGHVDTTGVISELERLSDSLTLKVEYARDFAPFIWAKGSAAINGVSLTLNQTSPTWFTVGLIPETLKRTNLGVVKRGDRVNLEIDNMARGLVNWARLQEGKK